MTAPIHIGDRGKTLGPLKPTGQITVNGRAMDASSEGTWIDPDTEVVIVGGNMDRAIVREFTRDIDSDRTLGEPLPEVKSFETTPLHSPPAWVEQVNPVAIGPAVSTALIPVVWLLGTPLNMHAILVPVAGVVAGWFFRVFVGTAAQCAGPREDHRPRARGIAMFVVAGSLLGGAVGVNMGFGFLGLSIGLAVGALVAGIIYVFLLVTGFL